MKQQHTLQPKLRFPDFEGDWQKKKFINYVKLSQGLQIPISERYTEFVEGSHFYITNEFLNKNSKSKYYILNPAKSVLCTEDDILMTRTGNTGKVVTNVNGAFHNNFFRIAYNRNVYKDFLYYFLINPKVQHIILSRAGTSTIPDLNHSDFYSMYFSNPSFPEQQKIADYLSTIDTKINLLEEKKAQLALYKKAMMQKLFAQEIRFKDDNGNDFPEWEVLNGGDLFISHTNKNHNGDLDVLAITQDNGAIPRKFIDYKVQVSDEGVNNYKIVEKNDFIISLRSFQGGIEHSNFMGICSPAYIVLKNKIPIEPLFFKVFFKSKNYINNLNRTLEGIRDGKMISYSNFAKSKIPFPSLPEQQKIANFLSAIDASIDKVTEQISQTQSFKKAMLQQMFV